MCSLNTYLPFYICTDKHKKHRYFEEGSRYEADSEEEDSNIEYLGNHEKPTSKLNTKIPLLFKGKTIFSHLSLIRKGIK